jgi:hypothetical protein
MLPLIPILCAKLPFLAGKVLAGNSELSNYIFQFIRCPHNNTIFTYYRLSLSFIGWSIFGITQIGTINVDNPTVKRF